MTPLDIVSGKTPMEQLNDAIVLLLLAIVVGVTNHVTSRFANRKIKEVNRKVDATTETVNQAKETIEQVNTSITKNNGGSSVKDYLDQIVANQKVHDLKFAYLEKQQDHIAEKQDLMDAKQDRQDSKIDAVDKKINDHIHEGLGRIVKRGKRRD